MRYDYKNKANNIRQMNDYMLAKTLSMFEYQNLPDTIPAVELEKLLQKNGFAYIAEVDGKLYALAGSRGGEMDAYGNPQDITINNIYLNFNKTLKIATDGVMFKNDDMYLGTLPYFNKANTLLAENDINMVVWGYNSRAQKLISAPDDKTQASAENYLKKIIDGDLSVIGESAFFDGVKMQAPASGSSVSVQQMIEFQQYIKASMYNEVGLSANFNMKRERLISSELDQSEDSLFPFVYNMMQNRINAINEINNKFGTNILIDFGSVWHFKNKELVDGEVNNGDLPDATKGTGNGNGTQPPATTPNPAPEDTQNLNEENNNEGSENSDNSTSSDSGNSETEEVDDNENADSDNVDSTDEQQQGSKSDSPQDEQSEQEPDQRALELQAVIDDPESSEEDIQAAKDLLAELEVNKNV